MSVMNVESANQEEEVRKELKKEQRNIFFRRIFANKLLVTGSIIMLFLTVIAILGPFIVSVSPYAMDTALRLQPPSMDHILGTDNFGRDLFSRVVYGAQKTLGVGLAVAVFASLFGLIIGLYSSYYKSLDHILMRISDGLMAIPAILLAIALMAALGPDTTNIIIALTIIFTPYIARVIRSSAIVVREQTYIEAMVAQGASSTRIIWLHIMPNTISPLIVQATYIFAEAVITEAALSFLGAGVPAPHPSWGNILYDGKLVIFNSWWMTVFPGIMIALAILGLNLLGDGLRDLIDPHGFKKRIKKKKSR